MELQTEYLCEHKVDGSFVIYSPNGKRAPVPEEKRRVFQHLFDPAKIYSDDLRKDFSETGIIDNGKINDLRNDATFKKMWDQALASGVPINALVMESGGNGTGTVYLAHIDTDFANEKGIKQWEYYPALKQMFLELERERVLNIA